MSVIKQNELLANYCTYRIGGPARCVFFAASEDEVVAGLETARENNIPFFILGGGSNVLFSDRGFPGLVLKMKNSFIEIQKKDFKENILAVGAGTSLAELVDFTRRHSFTRLEWAAGIPGTVGGAIRGNAGAFDEAIGDRIIEIKTLEVSGRGIAPKIFTKEECTFGYRDSIFKKNRNSVIISALMRFPSGDGEEIAAAMRECLAKKATRQPLDFPSAGSVFTNPPGYFAAKLIEDCGFKGKIVGGAQVSEKHSNFIINRGNATASDVKNLIGQIKKAAREKFNVELKEEIEIVEA